MGIKVKERIPGPVIFWIFIHHNGRRKAKKVGSEAAALKAEAMIEARHCQKRSRQPPLSSNTLRDLKRHYLDTAAVRDSSRRNYRSTFSHHILTELKSKGLDEITREDVQHLIGTLLVRKNLLRKRLSGSSWQTSAVS